MARSKPGSQAADLAQATRPSTSARHEFSLADTLAEWDDDRLERLLTLRPDLSTPAPDNLAQLGVRAASGPSVQDCLSHLDLGCCQLTEALCLLEQPTTIGRLVALLDLPSDTNQLEEPLDRLAERALLFRQGDQVRLLPVLAQVRYPAGLGPPAEALLKSQPVGTLVSLGEQLGFDPPSADAGTPGAPAKGRSPKARAPKGRIPKSRISKNQVLAGITAALSDANLVQRLVEEAPPQAADLAHQLAVGPPVTYSPYGHYHLADRTPLGWLANRGLVVPLSWDSLVMPREVAVCLRGGRPFPDLALATPEVAVSPVGADAVDRAAAEQALRLVGDVAAILNDWGDTAPKLLKAGGIGVREVRRAAKTTGRTEVEAARVIELAAVAGLAAPCLASMLDTRSDRRAGRPGASGGRAGASGGRAGASGGRAGASGGRAGGSGGRSGDDQVPEVALPRPAYDKWLTLPVADRWSALVRAWLGADLHVSLAGAIGMDEKPIPPLLARYEPEAVPRRHVVLNTLAEVAQGHSGEAVTVRQRAWWDAPGQWRGGPAMPDQLIAWVGGEAELLGLFALGSLSGPGRLVAGGQLEEATAALSHWAPAVTSRILLQADLTAVATGELAASVRQELALLADLESSGGATVCRFSETSMRRAFDAGRSAQDVMTFLEAHATKGVPQPLAYLVADLDRRHGAMRVGAASCYLRCDDPSLLAEVVRARRTSRLGLRQLAPTVLVSDADPATVTETLRTAGYLPAREQPDGSLVLVRSAPLRAPDLPLFGSLGERQGWTPSPDPVALVAQLRRAPGPAPGSRAAGRGATASGSGSRHGPLDQLPLSLPNRVETLIEDPEDIPDDEMHDREAMQDVMGILARAGLLETVDCQAGSSGGDEPQDEPGVSRPTEIARRPDAIEALLDQAGDEEWLVRMAYTNSTGQISQVTAAPLMVESPDVTVACLPRWENLRLSLDRIVWARMLTPAEEERVL